MRCPICRDTTLGQTELAPKLPAHACPRCAGVWIASSDYWAWLEQPDDGRAPRYELAWAWLEQPDDGRAPRYELAGEPGAEPAGARRCVGCGHIQLSYPITRDLPFRLDQCGHCNSFWLDRGEWATLRECDLHRRLHQITNEPWQRRLRQEERRATWEQIYTERFGAEDYAEIQRVRIWLLAHPQQAMLQAYLTSTDPYNP